ncbi:WD repeat-containing protein [Colletotrichum truncatum]|uniref:WD repeat-containing protein n=1 Tax=Colletotrichum truncatum TaxID=5467 RepID=A0ACC3Z5L2_COLTU|nr:WD repeat-containing protein [Colletotrichum truncatum]KAF6795150.1 WD repeat-containing protein [Colletotrichum truncatum]
MRPRTSETASQPSQAQATPATSNNHHSFASATPAIDVSHDHQHREPSQHHHSQEPPVNGANLAQVSYPSTDPLYYHPTFPVVPSSYYHDPHAFSQDQQYDDYEDYDEEDIDDEDDEDMDMSDSDGGAPLDHVMTVTSILSPMPETEAGLNTPEHYPGSPPLEAFTHTAHGDQLSPTEPPAHMVTYWSVPMTGPAFDPAGPLHPTPLNTIPFHPMLNSGGLEDDDDDDDVFYPPVAEQLQQFQVGAMDEDEAAWQIAGPPAVSNPNPSTLGPENLCLTDFLKEWAWRSRGNRYQPRGPSPGIQSLNRQAAMKVARVGYPDLEGDRYDVQGINWEDLGVTRMKARERRILDYKNYTNRTGSDVWGPHLPDRIIRNTENFFKFRRMDIRQNVHLAHFQLRNILACAGRSRAFYPGQRVVHQINPVSGQSEVAMDLGDLGSVQISTLDAKCGMLVAGTFNGEYCMRNIHSQDKKYTEGQITNHISGITNHLQIHESRNSSAPMAAFASNDQGFRVMDVTTEKFVLDTQYGCPINCSALSADRRLRAMVGDNYNVMIANADTGEILQELGGHRDFGFACDWSDNGWTVATGFQDMSVKIWDARKWTNSDGTSAPLTTIRSEMAGVRSLRFSPTGSGPRVLVAAEEADFVNIIDVQTLAHKQTFDLFGEIGGVEFTNDGQDLNILCMDRTRGGLVQLERCDLGQSGGFEPASQAMSLDAWWKPNRSATYVEADRRPRHPAHRERKASLFDDLEPF